MNHYRDGWREMPGAMVTIHSAVVGFVAVIALLLLGSAGKIPGYVGLLALIGFLSIMIVIVNLCAQWDLMLMDRREADE